MLSYAFQELRRDNFDYIASEKFENAHDLFAEIIVHGISAQLKRGLHRTYVEHRDNLPTLRGKLDLTGSISLRAAGRQLLACNYDDYSEDNLFNRILKSTLILLLRHPAVKPERKNHIRRILPFFATVSDTDLKLVRWTTLRFDRNSKSYQMLIYLCYFIADEMLLTTQSGDYRLTSFSDEKMCRLFEKFVLEYYRVHHPELKPCAKQIKWNIVEEESPATDILPILQTDIFLTGTHRTLIIDTKYYTKPMQSYHEKATIHSHNHAQIFQYVMNHDRHHTGTTDGMLLYARTQDEIQPEGHVTLHDGNVLYYRTLDLNQDFAGITKQLEDFVAPYLGDSENNFC